MSALNRFKKANDHDDDDAISTSQYVLLLISVSAVFILICFMLIFLYCKRKHRNRIGLERNLIIRQNNHDVHSVEPPPYNWHAEILPPSYDQLKF